MCESFVDFLVKINLQGWLWPCELSYGKRSCGPTYLVLLRGLPMLRNVRGEPVFSVMAVGWFYEKSS